MDGPTEPSYWYAISSPMSLVAPISANAPVSVNADNSRRSRSVNVNRTMFTHSGDNADPKKQYQPLVSTLQKNEITRDHHLSQTHEQP